MQQNGAIDQALTTVGGWLAWLFALVVSLFAIITHAMRQLMDQLHIAPPIQSVIMILLVIALIILAIRLFGGIFRILLMVFLVLLLLEFVFH
jgi:hypothetical protein